MLNVMPSEGQPGVIVQGDSAALLRGVPTGAAHLIVTSPPYNIGKSYERRSSLDRYIEGQDAIIAECFRILAPGGHIVWQVGNYVNDGEIVPLDIALYPSFARHGLKLRNRIIWHFEHGLHCAYRLSGRHETLLWFTKGDDYHFDLDPIRVPQKYPGKRHFKGPRVGELPGNPLGKNPGDVWVIPNVKHNHVEKTVHPCQYPVELVERLVLPMTLPGQLVLDPYAGVGTTVAAAVRHGRLGLGFELSAEYVAISEARVRAAQEGTLAARPMDRAVYTPPLPAKGRAAR
jgi:adenine-specific DNA-methyltransferase